jgi:NAD(P)-dependent dehydrogenase (short-subunit alcohol dehydrogenase family)
MATVVITGANRGIGLEIARIFKARGDDVVAVVRTSSPELDALDVRVEAGVDMTDDTLGGLAERLGDLSIDVLLNNAGLLRIKGLKDLDLDGIRAQFEVNTLGPLKVTAALRDNLAEGGKVVHITSRMGSITDNTSGGAYGYRMSKAALNMAAMSMSHDLKKNKIAVAVLHPGFVRTGMTKGNGNVDPVDSAKGLVDRVDALTLEESGGFWHAEGQRLPW